MSAVDHNTRNVINGIICFLTQRAIVFVKKFIDKLIDLFAIEVRRVFSLLEKEGRWVLQFFHLIQKYIFISITNTLHTSMNLHFYLVIS